MSEDMIYGPLPKREKTVSDLQLAQAALEAALSVVRARDRRATPEQICRAALSAVGSRRKEDR